MAKIDYTYGDKSLPPVFFAFCGFCCLSKKKIIYFNYFREADLLNPFLPGSVTCIRV